MLKKSYTDLWGCYIGVNPCWAATWRKLLVYFFSDLRFTINVSCIDFDLRKRCHLFVSAALNWTDSNLYCHWYKFTHFNFSPASMTAYLLQEIVGYLISVFPVWVWLPTLSHTQLHQGFPLSPILFITSMDRILRCSLVAGVVKFGGLRTPFGLLSADVVVLLASPPACTGAVYSWVWSSQDKDQHLEVWGHGSQGGKGVDCPLRCNRPKILTLVMIIPGAKMAQARLYHLGILWSRPV